jgi:putative transcriptional regulator
VASLRGQLLIASPQLLDPNFARTVLLVVEHNEEGAIGLVLNRPSEVAVADAVPELSELVEDGSLVYVGGPVEPGAVMVTAELDDPADAASLVFGSVGLLHGDIDRALAPRRVRVFAGYAGWAPDQLEGELAEDSWILEPAEPDDVFSDDADALWGQVLRRKGGRYGLIARMPLDPSVN